MTLPLSRDRILAALRRISPPWPSTSDDTSVGKELGSIATAIGMAADPLDGALDEVFPDTTEQLIERWEKITRIPTRTTDDIAVRRARVIAVLRRTAGPRLDQLAAMLADPLDIDAGLILMIEQTRERIEDALTEVDTTVRALSASPVTVALGKPWPGLIDDTGVAVYLKLSALGSPTVTLTHPTGVSWTIDVTAAAGWYFNRSTFTGLAAGGTWQLAATDATAPNLQEIRLLVSNDVDSAQIYNFFVYRDPDIAGTPDIPTAQRLLDHTVLAEMFAKVVQRQAFIVGDPLSLCGREPVGA